MQKEANASEVQGRPGAPPTGSRRGATTLLAAGLVVAVLVVGGLGAYLALPAGSNASHTTQTSTTTCAPANSSRCSSESSGAAHDLTVTVPFVPARAGRLA
jgi:hypothetical protein